MALLTSANFPGITLETPTNGTVTNPNSSVSFNKSDGTVAVIFDSVTSAMLCLAFMEARDQYYMLVNDDIMVVNVSGVKLIVMETTFINQKLMNSFSFQYNRGSVACVHRNLSNMVSLTDALVSVGFKKINSHRFRQ